MADDLRERLRQFLQDASLFGDPEDEGAVLTGCIAILEWTMPSGDLNIGLITSDATASQPMAAWRAKGMLHHAFDEMVDDEWELWDAEDSEE